MISLLALSPKRFEINWDRIAQSEISPKELEFSKTSHRCHLRKNLKEHTDHIQKNIIPRIEQELFDLTSPQINNTGETFRVAESIDYGDLFHAHIRDPLNTIPYSENHGLNPQFKDSKKYHLQYHSFEYRDYTHLKWIRELRRINNSELSNWLDELESYQQEMASRSSDEFANYSAPIQSSLNALNTQQKNRFALDWHIELGEQSPGLNHLVQRLSSIDPKTNLPPIDLFKYRSVVSTDDQFLIISPLNLPDHEQNATVYFEERRDSSEVEKIISKAKKHGLDSIVNISSQYFSDTVFEQLKNKDLHFQLAQELFAAAIVTTQKDKLYMFGHAFEDQYTQNQHLLITWSDKYLFSIRYFLPCNESDFEAWKNATSPRS